MSIDRFELMKNLSRETDSKIVFLVIDGLGGLPIPGRDGTSLELANTPNLDSLARDGTLGQIDPISPGISPGSGPGHLALFGYDPIKYETGRGLISALGIGFDLKPGDVAARVNFCTVEDGIVTDRRAGRIPTSKCAELAEILDSRIKLKRAELFVRPVKDYRAVIILRGEGLVDRIAGTDPQLAGRKPLEVTALDPEADKTAELVNSFVEQANDILKDLKPANAVLLRGFARYQLFPSMNEIYKLKAASIAAYPDYRGITRLIGMNIIECGETLDSEFEAFDKVWDDYNFFYVHCKKTDSAGEDGNADEKIKVLEELDTFVPRITSKKPAVIVVTGDHSTPVALKAHSWHPVPMLLSSEYVRPDNSQKFGELDCMSGGIGRIPSIDLMPLAMGYALKLKKYGA